MNTRTFLTLNKIRAILRPDFLSSGYGREKGDIELFGLQFSNRIGLGPGIDCNGDYINYLSELDFSHLCLGPVTLEPQENDAEINSKGVRYVISKLHECSKMKYLGLDITSSRIHAGDDEKTIKDFIDAFELSYDFADFFILDFSVPYLRNLVDPHFVISTVNPILETRLSYEKYRPVLVKIDSRNEELLKTLADYFRMSGVDGAILKGKESVSIFNKLTDNRFPIVAYGDIDNSSAAVELLSDGASMIHLSSELPVKGRKLISGILKSTQQQQQQ